MIAWRTGDLLQGFDPGSHSLAAPLVEELAGPGGLTIFPELLKGFLQKVGTDGLEVVAEEIAQSEVLVGTEVLAAAEQQPAGFPEDWGAALTFHAAGFLGTDVVPCLVHIGDDVEAVEDMQGFGAVFADELQIGFPHVGADEYDLGNYVFAHSGEESLEGFDGSLFAYPEKAGNAQIDLVDQGEVFVTFGVLDFVDSDGVNLAEHPVLQAPGDHVLNRVEDLVPGSAKRLGRFLPGQPACPAGQKQHVGFGESTFAIGPGDLLDDDRLAAAAIDAPHGVKQKNQKSPEGNKLETPFDELIVSGSGLVAARTNRLGAFARTYGDFDALVTGTEAGLLVNESRKAVAPI